MRHTPPGTRIDVVVKSVEDRVELTVADDGPGVPQADLSMLTRRFFRTEESRTSPGNGLGLALVSAVADLHGGQIRFSRGEPGLHALLSLPRVRNIGENHTS